MVAAPCSQSWDSMEGADRVRFCSGCAQNVYNVSAMKKQEAEQFLRDHGGTACVRFYRRPDGTILTDNCPVGMKGTRDGIRKVFGFVAAFFSAMMAGSPPVKAQEHDLVTPAAVGSSATAAGQTSVSGSTTGSCERQPLFTVPGVRPVQVQKDWNGSLVGSQHPIYLGQARRLSVHIVDERPLISTPAEALSNNAVKLQATVTADKTALNFYNLAQQNEQQGKILVAVSYLKQALASMDPAKTDWKFRELLEKDLRSLEKKIPSGNK